MIRSVPKGLTIVSSKPMSSVPPREGEKMMLTDVRSFRAARSVLDCGCPDTMPKVIHQRGNGSAKNPSPELVNNFAAAHSCGGEQLAAPKPRLDSPRPARARQRSPTSVAAPGPSAERTSPQEGSCIRLRRSRVPERLCTLTPVKPNWTEQNYFAALDWAKHHHDVIVVDRIGAIVADFQFPHTAEGWTQFEQQMQKFGKCPICLETSSGPAVDQLLQRDYVVYPINPKAAQRYRERKNPSGNKTDRHDAWSMADALRTDGHAWAQLIAQDEATAALRLLCRDENVLIEQRTALVNQLQAALAEYFPLAQSGGGLVLSNQLRPSMADRKSTR